MITTLIIIIITIIIIINMYIYIHIVIMNNIWTSQSNVAHGVGVFAAFGKGLVCDTVRLSD
jgi:hypothetical protein